MRSRPASCSSPATTAAICRVRCCIPMAARSLMASGAGKENDHASQIESPAESRRRRAQRQARRHAQVDTQGRVETDGRQHDRKAARSEEHTSELQSLMRISYAVFCLKKKKQPTNN